MEMLESLYNGKHFSICSRIVFLSMIQFSAKVYYRVEACFHGMFLKECCSKGFSAGIHVHFVLGVIGVIKDF